MSTATHMVPIVESRDEALELDDYLVDTNQSTIATQIIDSMAVRGPKKNEFIRTILNPAMRALTTLAEDKHEFSTTLYLVKKSLQPELGRTKDLVKRLLVPTMSATGAYFLWPVNVSERNGEKTRWATTAAAAVELATTRWIRVQADADDGGYFTFEAQGDLGEPEFPDHTLAQIMALAFKKENRIDDLNHPLVQIMRGLNKRR